MATRFETAWTANRLLGASPRAYALLKRAYDRSQGAPDVALRRILESSDAPRWPEPDRGRVLFFSPRYWPEQVSWQIVTAYALRAEGFLPEFVGCGGAARVCDMYAAEMRRGGFCRYCPSSLARLLAPTGFRYRELGDLVDAEAVRREASRRVAGLDLEACRKFRDGDVPVGRLIEASVARSLRRVRLEGDERALAVYRGFLETALVNLRGLERLLDEPWAFALALNGNFLAESMLLHLARSRRLDFVTYERGFRVDTLLFAVNEGVTDFDVSHHFERVKQVALSDFEEQRLRDYEAQRRVGEQGIVRYYPEIQEDRRAIVAAHGLDTTRKIAVAFPNIVWDTAVFGRERAFEGIWDWMRTTVETYASLSEEWQLVVRVHPAEVRLPARTRESMLDRIHRHFDPLPENVRLVPPESPTSPYALLGLAQRVLVYSSTLGLEAAMQGREVVTAARSHYAELGFTRDARDPQHYRDLLAAPPAGDDATVRRLARRYANLFFFRFHVPVTSVEEPWLARPRYRFESLRDLLSGRHPEVEFVRHELVRLNPGCQILPEAAAAQPGAGTSRSASPRCASVVVPAYNAEDSLEETLRALTAQTASAELPEGLEIIVVDDGSSDRTPQIARRFAEVRLLRQANAGPGAARNAGVAAARGEVILFTDSDCVPAPTWAAELLRGFREPGVALVMGRTETARPRGYVDLVQQGSDYVAHEPGPVSRFNSNNLALPADLARSLPFDAALRLYGEDSDLGWRVRRSGGRTIYRPEARVEHRHHRGWAAFLRDGFRHGGGAARLHVKHGRWLPRDLAPALSALLAGALAALVPEARGPALAATAGCSVLFLAALLWNELHYKRKRPLLALWVLPGQLLWYAAKLTGYLETLARIGLGLEPALAESRRRLRAEAVAINPDFRARRESADSRSAGRAPV